MMLALLGIFYATMVAGGYIIEFTFGGLGLVLAERAAKVAGTGITWNYTTILNIIFLLAAAALVIRFVRSGNAPMLKMMGGSPTQQQHVRGHREVLPHRGAQPAQQSLQAQISDQENKVAVPQVREEMLGWMPSGRRRTGAGADRPGPWRVRCGRGVRAPSRFRGVPWRPPTARRFAPRRHCCRGRAAGPGAGQPAAVDADGPDGDHWRGRELASVGIAAPPPAAGRSFAPSADIAGACR
jgi:hypothetical protein